LKLDTTKLDTLIAESPVKVDKAVRATAFDVQGIAVSLAAVDTGAMRASIFVKTHGGGQEPNALGDAEVSDPTPGDPPLMTAYVAPGVNYAGYVEFGTDRMAAQPFMTPAVEAAEDKFIQHIKDIFNE
jgi:HK97 gp10 family phage protein